MDSATLKLDEGNGKKNPGGMVALRLRDHDWDSLLRIKHKMEAVNARLVSITDVVSVCLHYTCVAFMDKQEVPVPQQIPAEVPAEEPTQTHAKAKRKTKPMIRKSY